MVARPPLRLTDRADAARRRGRRARHRARQLPLPVAAERVPPGARDEPPGALPRRHASTSEIVAYGGMWLMVDEAHITTFAVASRVAPAAASGGRLMLELMRPGASTVGRAWRRSRCACRTWPARALYERFGFRPVGIRPRYYSDNGEDALIMTTEPLDSPQMRERLARARRARRGTAEPAEPPSRRRGRRERSADPRRRDVVRRDRRRGRRGRPADPRQRRRQPGRAARARRAASCPRSPRAPTCAG